MCSLLELFTPIMGHVPTQGHFFISVCPLSESSQRDLTVNILTITVGRLFCPHSVCCLPYICIIEKHLCKCVKESQHKIMFLSTKKCENFFIFSGCLQAEMSRTGLLLHYVVGTKNRF